MIRFVLSAGVLAAMIGAAEAAPKCAPGKIYRVSQKVCVDKTSAIRSGVITPRQKASANRKAARIALLNKRNSQKAAVTRPVSEVTDPPAFVEDAPRAEATRTVIVPPVTRPMGSTSSPFGSLLNPWRTGSLSSYPEMQFSLRATNVD